MHTGTFEYAIVRVVPRVERCEFLNVGAIISSMQLKVLEARIEPDWERLAWFGPSLDQDLIARYLDVIPRICRGGPQAGPIGELPHRARFHWLVAPRSTIIQTSAVHSGIGDDMEAELERIMNCHVRRRPSSETGR